MGTGPLIAIDVMLLYVILGPVVLFGIYVLFDFLDPTGKDVVSNLKKEGVVTEKDPALWTSEYIDKTGFVGMGFDGSKDRF